MHKDCSALLLQVVQCCKMYGILTDVAHPDHAGVTQWESSCLRSNREAVCKEREAVLCVREKKTSVLCLSFGGAGDEIRTRDSLLGSFLVFHFGL
jgi:hypothetical protein